MKRVQLWKTIVSFQETRGTNSGKGPRDNLLTSEFSRQNPPWDSPVPRGHSGHCPFSGSLSSGAEGWWVPEFISWSPFPDASFTACIICLFYLVIMVPVEKGWIELKQSPHLSFEVNKPFHPRNGLENVWNPTIESVPDCKWRGEHPSIEIPASHRIRRRAMSAPRRFARWGTQGKTGKRM